jgi:hypothetical protein
VNLVLTPLVPIAEISGHGAAGTAASHHSRRKAGLLGTPASHPSKPKLNSLNVSGFPATLTEKI